MKLTPENKKHIDSLDYEGLLRHWRFASLGDPWFEGATGAYWSDSMFNKKAKHPDPVRISKKIGWK